MFSGDTDDGFFGAFICTCFGVSASEIREAIREGDLTSVDAVTRACKAGGGCETCHSDIEKMLEEWQKMKETL